MKKYTVVIAIVIVFIVIGVVIFMFMRSNQSANSQPIRQVNTSSSGISNLIASIPSQAWSGIFAGFGL